MFAEAITGRDLAAMAERCRGILTELRAQPAPPGTILSDVGILLESIGTNGLKTGGKNGNLPPSILPELNRRLAFPIELDLQRALLKDYPNLGAPFALLRAMELAQTGKGRLFVAPAALEEWRQLNPTEQYFALVETWLIYLDGSLLSDGNWRGDLDLFWDSCGLLAALPTDRWRTRQHKGFHYAMHRFPVWNLQLMMRFGLIEAEPLPVSQREDNTRGWKVGKARRTAWGEAFLWVLAQYTLEMERRDELWQEDDTDCDPPTEEDAAFEGVFLETHRMLSRLQTCADPEQTLEPHGDATISFHLPPRAAYGLFQPAFQPYFPDWQRVFGPRSQPEQTGVFIFKVGFDPRFGYGDVWRRLALPAKADLADLADAILASVKFDCDHGYVFEYKDRSGRKRQYFHPEMGEGPWASEVILGESGIPEGQTIKFLFDSGDRWRFLATLERVDPPDPDMDCYRVLASSGTPPRQYPPDSD